MVDLENKSFTYTVNQDGTVAYIAGADGKKQNLSGRDLSSKKALEEDLKSYTEAYLAGLKAEQVELGKGIVVGRQQEV